MGLQLTRGSEYGIRAMMYLASRPAGEICSLHDVGRAQDIPESFLAKLFQSLVHADLVVSHRGARGGFALARPAERINVAEVVEAIDGPVSLNKCVLEPAQCARSYDCAMRRVWLRAQESMLAALTEVTFADLAGVPV